MKKYISLLLAICTCVFVQAQNSRPNIVVIMADDLASNELSCYGGKNMVTKNIDRLASEGMRFTRMYASEAMCVPTRASLFTGLYPVRHGSYQNHKQVRSKDMKSVAHYMADAGYRVGLTGKNHSTKPVSVFPFEIVPGFEPNCVSPTDDYTLDQVKQYVSKKDKPFLLYVMSINPHRPWTMGDPSEFKADKLVLPPHFVDTKKTREEFCSFLAEVRRLDNQVGDIMKAIEESGQAKNTIVVFLGEQGPQFPGGKWTCWEYGTHSSMIVKYPGVVQPKSESGALVQFEDLLPTFLDIAGAKAIDSLDGKSFRTVLTGKSKTSREYAYGIHNNFPEGNPYPIRSVRNDRYKLILNLSPDSTYYIKYSMNPEQKNTTWSTWMEKAEHDAKSKQMAQRITTRPAIEFYDTESDPWELNNLAKDPSKQDMIAKLKLELDKWMKQQGDPGASIDVPFGKHN